MWFLKHQFIIIISFIILSCVSELIQVFITDTIFELEKINTL